MIADSELIADLQKTAAEHGEPLTRETYEEYGSYSPTTVRNHFGSWNEGLTEAEIKIAEVWKAEPLDVLEDIREIAEGNYAPKRCKYRSSGSLSLTSALTHFDRWWIAVVSTGLLPRERRPLTPEQFDQYYRVAVDLPPVEALPALIFMFSGMGPQAAYEMSSEWMRDKRDKNIVKLPSEVTDSGEPWVFRLPETWVNPYTGNRLRTKLPGSIEWVLGRYGRMPYEPAVGVNRKCFQIAEIAGIESRKQTSRYGSDCSKKFPLIRPADLSYTYGVNLVRQGLDSEIIERRLGTEGHRMRFSIDDIMTWVYVHDDYKHPEFDPPPVILDPNTGKPRYSE